MIVEFNIQHMNNDKYIIRWAQKGETFYCRLTFNDFRFEKLLSCAKQRISTTLTNRARENNAFIGVYGSTKYVWDRDASNLPDNLRRQAEKIDELPAHLRPLPAPVKEPERLFYIEMHVEGSFRGPVLKKADKPLMTWEEACAELKTKVG